MQTIGSGIRRALNSTCFNQKDLLLNLLSYLLVIMELCSIIIESHRQKKLELRF